MKDLYLWASRLSAVLGVLSVVLAAISGLTLNTLQVLPQTYLELAAVAFLFAILAHLYYSKE